MTSQEITRAVGALAVQADQTDWNDAQRAALVQLGLGDAPLADQQVFLTYAQRTGLDPWARQLYMIGRWDNRAQRMKYTMQASIDGLRIVAQRTGFYAGQVGPEWCGADGVWRDVWLDAKPPAAARVGVLRRSWAAPQYAVALFREYAQTGRDGRPQAMWSDKPALMIAKCAEALALRKAFPQDLSGLYTSDEMGRADAPAASAAPVQGQVTAERPAAPERPQPSEADLAWLVDTIRNAPSVETMGVQLGARGLARRDDAGRWWYHDRLAQIHVECDLGEGTARALVDHMVTVLPAADPEAFTPLSERPLTRLVPDYEGTPAGVDDLPHGLQSHADAADWDGMTMHAIRTLPTPGTHPERPIRLTPADRMRQAADAAHGETLRDSAPVADERRHGEGSEEYLDRLARALRRAGYVVHAPGEEACVPWSQHSAETTRYCVQITALESDLEDARAEVAVRHAEAPAPVPVKARKARSVPLPTAGSNAARLLAAYAEHAPLFGEEGMTATEAAAAADVPPGAWKRVSDLATLGLVGPLLANDAHVTRRRDGDRLPARVWVITPAGRQHLALLQLSALS